MHHDIVLQSSRKENSARIETELEKYNKCLKCDIKKRYIMLNNFYKLN